MAYLFNVRASKAGHYTLLVLIVTAGFLLRTWNINFDRGIGSHPDERSTACFYATTLRLPTSWEEFRDPKQSPLNPLWSVERQERRGFTYGHFPLYVGTAMGELFHGMAPVAQRMGASPETVALMARANNSCDAIAVAGRLTIALFDTLTILLLYWLGRRLYGRGAGLLVAAFYAFTAQAVQLSHFFAMDPASTTFTVLAVIGGVIFVQTRRLRAALLIGAAAGLAISSKFSALPVLAVPVVAAVLIFWEINQQRARGDDPGDVGRSEFNALMGVLVTLATAFVLFFITSPYAVLDWENFSRATLVEQGLMVRGVADFPFTRQYRNTLPYIYFIDQQVRWGMGPALGLVALVGTLGALLTLFWTLYRMAATVLLRMMGRDSWRAVPREQLLELIIWSWLVPYFGLTGAFLAKFNRYMSPVLPFVLLLTAGLLARWWRTSTRRARVASGDAAGYALHPDTLVEERSGADDAVALVAPRVRDEGADLVDISPGVQPNDETETVLSTAPVQSVTGWARARRAAAGVLATVGVMGGLFWSLAYVNGVYGNEHTWISASRWIYENVPAGSTILWELWDDPLPKSIPGEPGMDMGSTQLRNIDWSPYEEDTAEKYEMMKATLREADYVAYSSKRIYDSVDELPERYPMTTRYYDAMFDGSLGFDLVLEQTSPPSLLGFTFDDRLADESWSLYDHPQVSIFRKVRDLSDAEYDAIFDSAWEDAVPWYRGKDSPLSPLLEAVGLGSSPGSAESGLISRLIAAATGKEATTATEAEHPTLLLTTPLDQLPAIDNYRWNVRASEQALPAVLIWWAVLTLLGWFAWPISFALFRPLRDRGYFLSRTLGWLLAGWLLWWGVNGGLLLNTVRHAWLVAALLGVLGLLAAVVQWREMADFLRSQWRLLLVGEAIFAGAYGLFLLIRLANPDLWQPWFGGEKFMEFAFLNGILRSPTFPPVDPHFAGGYINYYYFGIYLVTYLIKLTGIYAEVAFNLAIPALFALTVLNAFGVAYSAGRRWWSQGPSLHWTAGLGAALVAPFLVAIIGNLDGFGEVVRNLSARSTTAFTSTLPGVESAVRAASGLAATVGKGQSMPLYDFWGPSRVIDYTINEFPYWSFLFADLHPHLIGIPFAIVFLALVLVLLSEDAGAWLTRPGRGVALLAAMALMLGTLASVNLWELPTYLGLGVVAFAMSQYRHRGRISWGLTIAFGLFYLLAAYGAFWPFFHAYENVGASGVGLVRAGDEPGRWLLIWGIFLFILASWLLYTAQRPLARDPQDDSRPTGLQQVVGLAFRYFDRLPRLIDLHSKLVGRSSIGYRIGLWLVPAGLVAGLLLIFVDRTVLAVCLPWLALGTVMLWRRGHVADPGTQFVALLTTTGFAILAGTQIVYLKDFLQGGDWYRMNTLFKFFSQVCVIWAMAAGIALPELWRGWVRQPADGTPRSWWNWRSAWAGGLLVLLAAGLAYPLFGTPARLEQRLMGWQPAFGTLNGLDYMRDGSYRWPDDSNMIELRYDWDAINWLLDHVQGNPVIVESSEVEYYRAGGSRVASLTGLSGLRGMHASEQRFGEDVGLRDARHREFWDAPSVGRTVELIDELDIALIYVGQLERYLHPEGAAKLEQMAADDLLTPIFTNEGVIIYAVPGQLAQNDKGFYSPS